MMNLRDLQYIVAVADHQNFTHAAKAIHVSQPALSNQIKKVEAELGVEIFERTRNKVGLTDFGVQLLASARQINELVNGISELALQYRAVEATPLRLGVTPTLAAYLSRYFFDMMAALYPDLKLVIVEEKPIALAQMVEDQQLDLALIARKSHNMIYGDEAKRVMEFMPLWLEPLFLGVRRDHPLTQDDGILARQVPPELFIRFDVPFGYDLEKDLPLPAQDAAERVGIDVRTARFETVCRHVAHSDACTIINAIAAVQFERDNLGLAFIPFRDDGNLRELGAIIRPGYSRRAVVEAIQAYIQATPPPGTMPYAAGPTTPERVSALLAV